MSRSERDAPGAQLPEQALATLCNVSRTPIRAALKVLADKGVVARQDDAGYRLAVDLSSPADFDSGLPRAEEAKLARRHPARPRGRAHRRHETVTELQRRYDAESPNGTKRADKSDRRRYPGRARAGPVMDFQRDPRQPAVDRCQLRVPPAARTGRRAGAGVPARRREGGVAASGHGCAALAAGQRVRHRASSNAPTSISTC